MTQGANHEPKSIESLIYQVVGTYISRRLESKHGLRWEEVKDSPGRKKEYEEERAKVAKDAFLAIRARTGADFINYFASTLCSVPQHVKEESYIELTRQLHSDTDRVRTLTLLALSARG